MTHVSRALARAATLGEEVRALVAPLDDRYARLVLHAWGWYTPTRPRLQDTASVFGLTRERVRQKVAIHEHRLRHLAPVLPQLVAVAALLTRDSQATPAERLQLVRAAGFRASPQALRVLPALIQAGIVRHAAHSTATSERARRHASA